jgi:tRNA threonylcarbamoyladenosine biosynthesis protein TsaB
MDETSKHLAVAIDTSGRAGSVALGSGEKIFGKFVFDGQMRHAAELLPSIKNLIADSGSLISDITEVYVTDGPGSFTGLRIGITAAKMLALAVDVRIVAVSSLYCTAMNAFDYAKANRQTDIQRIVAVIDAKRGQFFFGCYEKTGEI